ncbi:hypothetical protein B296_00022346 [Ensete ventricosum]|uniref:Uncharacterized protein n=1 Tax=Ensete ventricosum TaxID=4639 RepID=A0A426Y8Q2_ENSVE|nr:hypothetical protein B296_00022346 [Ensete ventricosum]
MRRINWPICIWILLLLLLCTLRHVRVYADIFLFWVHGLHLLRVLPNAWDGWLPCCFALCAPHISIHQV